MMASTSTMEVCNSSKLFIFLKRKGLPCKFISDNGKTFLTTLHQAVDVQSYLSSSKIECSFNTEKAPWWGFLKGW
jgi:hypothetical protein